MWLRALKLTLTRRRARGRSPSSSASLLNRRVRLWRLRGSRLGRMLVEPDSVSSSTLPAFIRPRRTGAHLGVIRMCHIYCSFVSVVVCVSPSKICVSHIQSFYPQWAGSVSCGEECSRTHCVRIHMGGLHGGAVVWVSPLDTCMRQ